MSRFSDDGDEPDYNNAYELWQANLVRALGSPRGQGALTDLREALLALPDRRLIARALCTVGAERGTGYHEYFEREYASLVQEQGQGVCTVGAFAWYQKVKSGADPAEAFASLPTLEDFNHGDWETAAIGAQAGLARTLAQHLAYLNDEDWGDLTPEQRWQKCMDWIDAQTSRSAVSA